MRIPALLLVVGLVGCPSLVRNPTGDCTAAHDGSRPCAHAPEPGDQYLPDCRAPLQREYWRVFASAPDTAWILPRPDAAGLTHGICDGDDPELAALFERTGLCEPTPNLSRINALTPADALDVTHALHQRLDFEAVQLDGGIWAISPHAWPDDLVAACTGPGAGMAALAEFCDTVTTTFSGGTCPEIALVMSAEVATTMADALDQLYGIESP